MPMLSKPAFGPRTAIIYITAGALIDVWTAVWYFAIARREPGGLTPNMQFWLWGFFLTGLTLIVVGVLLGHIGRAARRSELPPQDVTLAEAQIQAAAASHPNPVVAGSVAPQSGSMGEAQSPMMAPAQPATAVPPSYAATTTTPGYARR